MATFPGDMNIGWGFGLQADEADCRFIMAQPDEPQEETEEVYNGFMYVSVPVEEEEHCTGSPTCQCAECRLTEWNSGRPPEEQILPPGYRYEPPEIEPNRAVGLYAMDEPHLTDPLLAVSELEERLDGHADVISAQGSRITDLEECLRSLTIVVNDLVKRLDTHIEENTFNVDEFERIGRELEEKE